MKDREMWTLVVKGLGMIKENGSGNGEIRIILRNNEAKHVNVSYEVQPNDGTRKERPTSNALPVSAEMP